MQLIRTTNVYRLDDNREIEIELQADRAVDDPEEELQVLRKVYTSTAKFLTGEAPVENVANVSVAPAQSQVARRSLQATEPYTDEWAGIMMDRMVKAGLKEFDARAIRSAAPDELRDLCDAHCPNSPAKPHSTNFRHLADSGRVHNGHCVVLRPMQGDRYIFDMVKVTDTE